MAVWSSAFSWLPTRYVLVVQAYQESQDIANNRSLVRYQAWVEKVSGSGYFTSSGGASGSGNPGSFGDWGSYDFTSYSTLWLMNTTFWVNHNADGTGSVSIYGNAYDPNNLGSADIGSNTLTLTTIPRATVPEFARSAGTVTLSIANPCVVTKAGHGYATGQKVFLSTTGSLPTGLAADTPYYVINVNANTLRLATSAANAAAGTAIATTGSQSGTHTLWTPIVAPSTLDAGSSCRVILPRAAAGFTHNLTYSFGALTAQTSGLSPANGAGTSSAFTPPLTLLNQIPNSASGVLTLTAETRNGATVIGTREATVTLAAPASAVPTIGSLTISEGETSPDVAVLIGAFVQGVSKLAVTINGAAGVYGSSIVSYQFAIQGQSGSTVNAQSGVIPNPVATAGAVTVTARVTDTRGRQSNFSGTVVNVLAYTPPSIASLAINRYNLAIPAIDPEHGTDLSIALTAAVQSLIQGSQKNQIYVKIESRPSTGGAWQVHSNPGGYPGTGLSVSSAFIVPSGGARPPFSITSRYEIRVTVSDKLTRSAVLIRVLPTGALLVDYNGNDGVGIGKYHENGMLDVAGDIYAPGVYQGGFKVVDLSMLATTAAAGIVELATDAETIAGTRDDLAVTPEGLAAALAGMQGYRFRETRYYTANDTFQKASYPWLRAIRVRLVGGGGGGGGAAATSSSYFSIGTGGGGGGYAEAFITNIAGLASSVTVARGAGGTAPSGGGGGAGGTSSFGSLVSATGGGGGSVKPNSPYSPYVVAGAGGTGTAGDLLINGSGGTTGAGSNTLGSSGSGGSSQLGGGAHGVGSGSTGESGVAGGNYGGGGSGAMNSSNVGARPGGVGAPGIVIVEMYE